MHLISQLQHCNAYPGKRNNVGPIKFSDRESNIEALDPEIKTPPTVKRFPDSKPEDDYFDIKLKDDNVEPSQLRVFSRKVSELKYEIYKCTQQLMNLSQGIEAFKEEATHQFVTTKIDEAEVQTTKSPIREATTRETALTGEHVLDTQNPPLNAPNPQIQHFQAPATFMFPEQINIPLKASIIAHKPIHILILNDALV
ncbi:hypothetical protein ACHWQZ_G008582 [Mnemiopsis leidyi]